MPASHLTLLGSFRLTENAIPIQFDQSRLIELVARLALEPGQPLSRQRLAYDFWPDSNEKQARTNVRNLLYKLKRAWPTYAHTIESSRQDLTWRMDAPIIVDVHSFEAALGQAEQAVDTPSRVSALAHAAQAYAGDLLPDLYSDWVLGERERLRGRFAACLERLIPALLDLRRPDEALGWAKTLQRHDPLHESAYRLTMTVYATLGDRSAALRTYHACASLLEQELGVAPSPATQALYDRLLNGAGPQSAQVAQAAQAHEVPKILARPRLVGRDENWQRLLAQWRRTQQGQPHMVLIWGEAGMGKTRLAEELTQWADRRGHLWANSRSYAAQGALVYAPIAEWMRAPRLRAHLSQVDDLWQVELARLIPDLLAHRQDLPPPGPLAEDWQRRRFYEGILQALFPKSDTQTDAVLLHLDDMQWADSETLAVLNYLLWGAGDRPLLIVGTVRSEEAQANLTLNSLLRTARKGGLLTEITLGPLSFTETAELAAQTANKDLSAAQNHALYELSEGHPLFLVETVRAAAWDGLPPTPSQDPNPTLGQGEGAAGPRFTIPPKIQALLTRRLDQLSPSARQLAEVAAVVGREFDYPTLHGASQLDESALVGGLDELWRHRIVREQGETAYDFSHDRIREVAYGRISRARRRLLHRQVAQAMEALHAPVLDEVAGQLADHYQRAGMADQARSFYRQAGEVALAQYALPQARELFDAALVLTPKADWQERFDLLQKLDSVHQNRSARKDLWDKVLAEQAAITQALAADPQVTTEQLAPIRCAYLLNQARRLSTTGQTDADRRHAIVLCQEAIVLAEPLGDVAFLARAHTHWGFSAWSLTDMTEAKTHYAQAVHYAELAGLHQEEAIALEMSAAVGMFTGMPAGQIRSMIDRSMTFVQELGHLPRVASLFNKLGYLPIAQGTGEFEQAAAHYTQGLTLARQIGYQSLITNILRNIGHMETCRGDYGQAQPALTETIRASRESSGVQNLGAALHYEGEWYLQQGDFVSAAARLQEAEAVMRAVGLAHFRVKCGSDLGLLHHLRGEDGAAETVLTEALELVTQHGDTRYIAQINVRLGYVQEAQDRLDAARRAYSQGVELHHQMDQLFYAAMGLAGLARLHHRAGETALAQALVREIWQVLESQTPEATIECARMYVTCCHILTDTDPELAGHIAVRAKAQLDRRAATIDHPEREILFWQIPDHRAVLACQPAS